MQEETCDLIFTDLDGLDKLKFADFSFLQTLLEHMDYKFVLTKCNMQRDRQQTDRLTDRQIDTQIERQKQKNNSQCTTTQLVLI